MRKVLRQVWGNRIGSWDGWIYVLKSVLSRFFKEKNIKGWEATLDCFSPKNLNMKCRLSFLLQTNQVKSSLESFNSLEQTA